MSRIMLVGLIAIVALGLMGTECLFRVPASFREPLRRAAKTIAGSILKYSESLNPEDPDRRRAEWIKNRYLQWRAAWERMAGEHPGLCAA